ncbi:hypothetical protein ACRALDRAFT_1061685 [Sodiomyces alcalophilus JCM 7366]|uniref:uncharacterized protein n=1 Tax=Sodiomyces alcalophilus JCM 7366 TaxID=591952 RepID=UPI0039B6524B
MAKNNGPTTGTPITNPIRTVALPPTSSQRGVSPSLTQKAKTQPRRPMASAHGSMSQPDASTRFG